MKSKLEKEMNASIEDAEKKQYSVLVEETKPPTPVLRHFCFAYLVGGGICCFGQMIYKLLSFTELSDKHCVTVTLVILIFQTQFFIIRLIIFLQILNWIRFMIIL